jgi:phosphohistidine phosphatase
MKKLYIVRHAKSDWGNDDLKDIDRPLNSRGYGDAYHMSKKFLDKRGVPDLLVASPAIRSLSTALIFARTFAYEEHKILMKEGIYESTHKVLQKTIAAIHNDFGTVMLFGHNPGLTNLFNEVSDSFIDNIPTCGIIGIEFNSPYWKDILSSKGNTIYTDFPKEFK